MRRKIIIDEAKEQELIGKIFESVFTPNPQQVIEIKEFLDKNFRKERIPTIGENGYSVLEDTFVYHKNGVDLQTMNREELIRMLDDKFHKRIKDDNDRKRFLEQVLKDWSNHKIKNGLLSVNRI